MKRSERGTRSERQLSQFRHLLAHTWTREGVAMGRRKQTQRATEEKLSRGEVGTGGLESSD